MKLIQAYVDEDVVNRFKAVMALRGVNMTDAIAAWMKSVADEIHKPNRRPRK